MGEMIEFASNGGTCTGYLSDGGGPGVVVIQEWWGLVPHIKDVTDRFGDAGFTALAPDLYHGDATTEPDGAGKLMMALNLHEAARDMSGAVDVVVERSANPRVGVVGYCMGGGLALVLATTRPDAVKACAPYYGLIPWASAQPDWSKLEAKVVGEYAALDHSFTPEMAAQFEAMLRGPRQGRHAARARGGRPRVLQRRPPRGVQRRGLARGVGAHARPLPRAAHPPALTRPGGPRSWGRAGGTSFGGCARPCFPPSSPCPSSGSGSRPDPCTPPTTPRPRPKATPTTTNPLDLLTSLGLTNEQIGCLVANGANLDSEDIGQVMQLMTTCGIDLMDLMAVAESGGITGDTSVAAPTTAAVAGVPTTGSASSVLDQLGLTQTVLSCVLTGLPNTTAGDDDAALKLLQSCGGSLDALLVAALSIASAEGTSVTPGVPTTVAGAPVTVAGTATTLGSDNGLVDLLQQQLTSMGITLTDEQAQCIVDNMAGVDTNDLTAMAGLLTQCGVSF